VFYSFNLIHTLPNSVVFAAVSINAENVGVNISTKAEKYLPKASEAEQTPSARTMMPPNRSIRQSRGIASLGEPSRLLIL
jgi:hypothetical protein